MLLKKIALTHLLMMTSMAAYADIPFATVNAFDNPVFTQNEHAFLSIQVAEESPNLFESKRFKKHKKNSTKFFDTQGKKISSKIRLAEQHFVSGSKAEYLVVVKRHSLFLKFQYSD